MLSRSASTSQSRSCGVGLAELSGKVRSTSESRTCRMYGAQFSLKNRVGVVVESLVLLIAR
jgi:hypothetical protein